MGAPQIIYITLNMVGILTLVSQHGKTVTGKVNAVPQLIGAFVGYGLLIWGGFFG